MVSVHESQWRERGRPRVQTGELAVVAHGAVGDLDVGVLVRAGGVRDRSEHELGHVSFESGQRLGEDDGAALVGEGGGDRG